jgi:integration host factor subunit alpha
MMRFTGRPGSPARRLRPWSNSCSRIVSCLERGEAVKLSAFGSFIVRQKSPRMGRNPKTGKSAPIPPGRGVIFKPSAVLKQRINLRS